MKTVYAVLYCLYDEYGVTAVYPTYDEAMKAASEFNDRCENYKYYVEETVFKESETEGDNHDQ